MNRRTPLSMLIELQRRARDESARQTARSRRDADSADATLRMLKDYGADHASRAPGTASPAFTAGTLRIRDAFAQRLDQAIGEQDAVTRRLEQTVEERERALLASQQRLKALETLSQRRGAASRQRAARQEQAGTDEFALQSYLRARKAKEE